ncbi:TolB family protein [Flagellimonas sp. CMM7]|uniref:TolB family protein n=1 Tax=Flagellimonas sp. CMM7 TaxID=2654676 RepID=UPI001969E27E|nr:PD40 domain-containing protein [Flagellimonas sp. CMM7]
MKTNATLYILLFISFLTSAQEKTKPNKVLFEPGNISTKHVEYGATFTDDGAEMYFARSKQEWGKNDMKSSIYHSFFDGEKWSKPQIVSFSGTYDDSDPHVTSDGKTIYFISKRPSSENTISPDIWMVKRTPNNSWTEPERIPNPINSEKSEYSPCTDSEGNLYFASNRPGGYGQGDLYMVVNEGNRLKTPINLGSILNSDTGEWNLGVSADGNTLIFEASERKQNVSAYGDLYISFKKNGFWTIPQNITELNTSGSDLYPFLDKHTRQLYFTSSDSLSSGDTNIYKVAFDTILKKYQETAKVSSIREKCLTNNTFEDRYASYSPDGENILFESDRDGSWEIYTMDKNGQNMQQLTNTIPDNRRPSWHPNGKKVLFESNRNGKQALFTYDLRSGKIKRLSDKTIDGEFIFASFSPRGNTIAVSLKISEDNSHIVLLNKKGRMIKKLTNNQKRNYYPKWSIDGKEIVYFSRKDTNNGDDEIYRYTLETGLDTRLTSWHKHNFCPSWSNDNKKIVYVTSMENTRPEIYIMDVDGSNQLQVTNNNDGETLPVWHPKENKILVTAYRNGNYEICELALTNY